MLNRFSIYLFADILSTFNSYEDFLIYVSQIITYT
ncbi:hypothetical protein QE417_000251 [Mucilaginibacter terrae]|uniref:Uncharacterized protein n=1 Tax=Mucilaginibacter terrae TaxID=1955052 RepID=A0ABU3GN23_9SPHI|nr:hypothetical protein [Mucilaginibacter terrae]